MTSERDCPRPWQDENSFSEWGHYGAPRDLGGIPGRPPRGLQPVRRTCQEGHNHAERYPAGMPHKRGEELRQS